MKTIKFFATAIAVFSAVLLSSCTKESNNPQNLQESTMYLSISPSATKASGASHGNQADDNTVNTLEVFVFRNEGEDAGMLDAYKKFEGSAIGNLTNLEIKTTTGAKRIHVIANSHKDDFNGIKTLTEFESALSLLQKEDVKSFTMTGTADVTLAAVTPVTLAVQRLVAKICVSSIKTDFTGTPYEGSTLSNVKLYLLNVNADRTYAANAAPATPLVLNHEEITATDVNGCTMINMIYDEIPASITETAYTTKHYFYSYENLLASESGNKYFTRLVLQADLNNKTYYYPININREEYGYVESNGHKGVKRNTAYEMDIVITRPGSLDPNKPIQYGTLQLNLNVVDWATTPKASIIF